MSVYYYLTVFPMEALIASERDPESFGTYMATGSSRGSSERLIFVEVDAEKAGDAIDTAFAEERCASKEGVKNSVYLSIYRALESIPLDSLKSMYLMTRDGRSLELQPEFLDGTTPAKPFFLYQELSPVHPLVVSSLDPAKFCNGITNPKGKVHLPTVAVADLKVVDLDNLDDAGNIGDLYYQNITHLRQCIASVTQKEDKQMKILDRSRMDSFTYNLIDTGIYFASEGKTLYYRMKTEKELRVDHYAWGKSADIL